MTPSSCETRLYTEPLYSAPCYDWLPLWHGRARLLVALCGVGGHPAGLCGVRDADCQFTSNMYCYRHGLVLLQIQRSRSYV